MIEHKDSDQTYYSQLGPLYDQLKAGDNLQAWADLLIDQIREYSPRAARVLDVGCGTGGSSQAFRSRGFDVVGCDISVAMLSVARARHADIDFIQADVRSLPGWLAGFDIVNLMGDVPNHLLTIEDLDAAFAGVSGALTPDGVVTFDVNTATTYRELFRSTHVIERPGSTFVWIGETPDWTESAAADLRLLAFEQTGPAHWERHDCTLTEHHYLPAQIEASLGRAGLIPVGTFGLHQAALVQPANEDVHAKTVYFAQHAQQVLLK